MLWDTLTYAGEQCHTVTSGLDTRLPARAGSRLSLLQGDMCVGNHMMRATDGAAPPWRAVALLISVTTGTVLLCCRG